MGFSNRVVVLVGFLAGCTGTWSEVGMELPADGHALENPPRAEQASQPQPEAVSPAVMRARVGAFWAWWEKHEPDVVAGLTSGLSPGLADQISEEVGMLHPGLGWEVGPGNTTDYSLSLRSGGDPMLRRIAELWVRGKKTPSERFEFRTSVQPGPVHELADKVLQLDGIELDIAQFRFLVQEDDTRRLFSLQAHHPVLVGASSDAASGACFAILDAALGEASIERWVESVEVVPSCSDGCIDLTALRSLVDRRAKGWQASPESWARAEGASPDTGAPILLALDFGPRRWDHPLKDRYFEVQLPYTGGQDGLPDSAELDRLARATDTLVADLPADAVLLGWRTGDNERAVFGYYDSESGFEQWLTGKATGLGRPFTIHTDADVYWSQRP